MNKRGYDRYFEKFVCSDELPVAVFSEDSWVISNTEIPFLHFHDTLEITYWVEGEGAFVIENAEHLLHAGDLCALCPNTMHLSRVRGNDIARCKYLYIDLDRFRRMVPGFEKLDYLKYHSPQFKNVITPQECPEMVPLLLTIFREMDERALNSQAAVLALTGLLLNHLLRLQDLPAEHTAHEHGGTFVLAAALEHMNLHYADEITTEELASLCFMSATNFRRIFHRIMQTSPMAHLNHVRIQKSCEKLFTTNESILQISEHVGFSSVCSFNRNFKKLMQLSPHDWRKAARISRQ
ncbi:MAG: helix-turn-helix transcriptional regulator [Clostridia bacterium]|nr:helix-turn-helix transcriptional regulator [Clostridia bacterium]